MNWRDEAACLKQDPELFFPIGMSVTASKQVEAAKRLCGRCGVRDACLEWAVTTGIEHGVWGGLSEEERRSRKRRSSRARTAAALTREQAGASRPSF
jgi:WhiB family redox-sensing transcriptional regulator